MSSLGGAMARLGRSFAAKLVLLLAVFVAVPAILYQQFRTVDEEKNALLMAAVEEEGRLIAKALEPLVLADFSRLPVAVAETVARLGGSGPALKVLFRPRGAASPDSFFYVAAAPAVAGDYLERDRTELIATGVLDRLAVACEGELPLAVRYVNPAGREEILTSLTPLTGPTGCWVVITAHGGGAILASSVGLPYWRTPEVQAAAAIYGLMALVVLSLFFDVWGGLRRFRDVARAVRERRAEAGAFARLNRVPELAGVAEDFDRLVQGLSDSERLIRQAAEENAHALKAPLAVISQAVEPLRRALPDGEARARRGLELIEQSVIRLDALVSAARRMDEAIAESLDPPRQPVDLSRLLASIAGVHSEAWAGGPVTLTAEIEPGLQILGDADLIETAIENLLDNARGFSPEGGRVTLTLRQERMEAVLAVEDEGPGVAPDRLERIFARYFSERPGGSGDAAHSGIGLWVVRRNAEAMGGWATAENRPLRGLRVLVHLPLAG